MRRTLVRLLIAVAVALAAITGVWWWATAQMLAGLHAGMAAAGQRGWSIAAGSIDRGGWPLAAEVHLAGVSVTGGRGVLPQGLSWHAEHVVLRIPAWQPQLAAVRVLGAQRWQVGGGPEVPFATDRFVVTVPLRDPSTARLEAHDLVFAAPLEGMSVGLLEGDVAWHPQAGKGADAIAFELAVEAVRLPTAARMVLGGRIASASCDGALEGPLPPHAQAAAQAAAAWRDGGGRIALRRYAIGWGPLGVTGALTLGLDSGLQPQGSGTARVVGYDAALASLAESGAIPASAERAGRAVLALLAQTPAGGGTPQVTLPLALKDGIITAGRIPVGRVPPLAWPAP